LPGRAKLNVPANARSADTGIICRKGDAVLGPDAHGTSIIDSKYSAQLVYPQQVKTGIGRKVRIQTEF
jgi:hypothetical protein